MKFGKLSSIEGVDFTIPKINLVNSDTGNTSSPKLYLGTTGWSNKEWLGSYYPKKTKNTDHLIHYGKLFNTIELNTTHYQIPSTERIEGWYEKVDSDFNFCPKVPQVISHQNNLASETSHSHNFFKVIEGFNNKLGPCFMQLPEHFAPSQTSQLLQFLSRKPKNLQFAIELRHRGWFQDGNRYLTLLAKELTTYNTSLVISDVAGRRDVCHGLLSTPVLIIRLVGNSLHPSDFSRMDQWIQRIREAGTRLDKVYLFFHQPSMEQIPEMMNYFIEKMQINGLISPISPLKPKYQENTQLRLF